MELTDEIIVQALTTDGNMSLVCEIIPFSFITIAIIILFLFAFSSILACFKKKKIKDGFSNIAVLAVMLVFFVGIPLFMGRPSFEQYKYYSAAIKNSTFDVLKVEIEDKNLETYSWILKNFGTIQVSQMNYHSFEKGETVYIVYVPYKEGKYLFTDWIYSAKDYYRE